VDQWIGEAIFKMRSNKITQEQVASKMGVGREYINKILTGKKEFTPKNAESRIMAAIDEIIKEKA
jgi:transcriptional regulator with XRE-family HTH domain